VVISIFGIVVGLASIEHGVGEISQRSARPAGLLIQSWADTAAFSVLAGEPALTVLPTFVLSGILTVMVASALSVWSVFFVQRRGGGLVLILLSLILLLVGGGLGPPLIGVILGVAALRMHALPRHEVRRLLLPLAWVWKWALVAGVAGYLALLPGTVLLYHFAGGADETIVYGLALFSFAALILSLVAARTADRLAAERRGRAPLAL
jgi:hypothetical protein